jgi:hypothetical protein
MSKPTVSSLPSPMEYASAPRRGPGVGPRAIAALSCALASLLPAIYFLLVLIQERRGRGRTLGSRLELPSQALCEVACFAIPIWAIAALVFALRSAKCRERWRRVALASALLACVGATWFVWSVIGMVFFTPW